MYRAAGSTLSLPRAEHYLILIHLKEKIVAFKAPPSGSSFKRGGERSGVFIKVNIKIHTSVVKTSLGYGVRHAYASSSHYWHCGDISIIEFKRSLYQIYKVREV